MYIPPAYHNFGLTFQPDIVDLNLFAFIVHAVRKSWPPSDGMQGDSREDSFSIGMDNRYRYSPDDDAEQPDELFLSAHLCSSEIQMALTRPSEFQENVYTEFLEESFADLVFSSNAIEGIKYDYGLTMNLCLKTLRGELAVIDTTPQYTSQASTTDITSQKNELLTYTTIYNDIPQINQHARALKYLIHKFVVSNSPLSEDLICQTHYYLCNGIPSPDGSNDYAGRYRTESVVADLSTFSPHACVPFEMASLIQDFNADIAKANRSKISDAVLDPFMLASKYCHKLVNIHPFLDGNGRMCRLLLNAILLKYAGIVIALGETEKDIQEYLHIARSSNIAQQQHEIDEYNPPWAELATLVLKKAKGKLVELNECLSELGR